MNLTRNRRPVILLSAGLLLVASLFRAPAVYFCPEMGALPRACCDTAAPDGLGGPCCRFIAMDQDGLSSGRVTPVSDLPPAEAVLGDVDLMTSVPVIAPRWMKRYRDPDRSSPPPLHILLSTFLC